MIGKRKNQKAKCCNALKVLLLALDFSFFYFIAPDHQSLFWGFISVSDQVYDGKDGAAPLLGTYTGMSMQGLFLTSTSNYLWLEFSSDQETTAAGFQLTYYSKSHFITRGGGGP